MNVGAMAIPQVNRPNQQNGAPLGELRDELRLHEGPADFSGAPTWTLEDPLSGRFYRLGWLEMEMLARWHLDSAEAIQEGIQSSTTLEVDQQEIQNFARFLSGHRLLNVYGEKDLARLSEEKSQRKTSPLKWLLKNYLFLRVPICSPDRFLDRTLPIAKFFISKFFICLTLMAAVLGGVLVSHQWSAFTHTFLYFFSFEGIVLMGVALFLTKLLHELGHAYSCKLFGGRVATMGVAFLVLWPVLYTDTSGSWRLKRKHQRMMIGAAGVLVEIIVAVWAMFIWSFLADGVWRSLAFMLSTTWVLSLLINLSPFMRFDGYFLFSDFLGMPNLQQRAFAYTRWQLREWLFGFKEAAPEYFSSTMRKILLFYSVGTWVYRLFLFIGIALMVYHFAFKVLGIVLFTLEMLVFVLLPVFKELKEWSARRSNMSLNRNAMLSMGLLVVLICLVFIPWRGEVSASAILRAEQQSLMFVPENAQLVEIAVEQNTSVKKGERLFRFYSPELEKEALALRQQLIALEKQNKVSQFDKEASSSLSMVREELASVPSRLLASSLRVDGLTVVAPFDGYVADLSEQFAVGNWLSSGEWLATVVGQQGNLVEAFIEESDLSRIKEGNLARFIPENSAYPEVTLRLNKIEETAVSRLSSAPELSSVYGGEIASKKEHGDTAPHPEKAIYRAYFVSIGDQNTQTPNFVMRGKVVVEGEPQSVVSQLWRRVYSVVIREMSF
jgi:putative peptide zinc metalloprotease protein